MSRTTREVVPPIVLVSHFPQQQSTLSTLLKRVFFGSKASYLKSPDASSGTCQLHEVDKQPAGGNVAFLPAVATPLQIRPLAAHFPQK
jgi:hypothetical protein